MVEKKELFQRVKDIQKAFERSGKPLHESLGINFYTFRAYLNEKRQDKLRPLLDRILAVHPEISRRWLYFGEGPMLAASDDLDNVQEQELLDELSRARTEALDLRDRLQEKVSRIDVLEKECAMLRESVEDKKQIIALLLQRTQECEPTGSYATGFEYAEDAHLSQEKG